MEHVKISSASLSAAPSVSLKRLGSIIVDMTVHGDTLLVDVFIDEV